jgi:hypothetical protein
MVDEKKTSVDPEKEPQEKSLSESLDQNWEPDPLIEAYKKDVDITLIKENLRLTIDQRFEKLMELQRFAEELRNAGRKARMTTQNAHD